MITLVHWQIDFSKKKKALESIIYKDLTLSNHHLIRMLKMDELDQYLQKHNLVALPCPVKLDTFPNLTLDKDFKYSIEQLVHLSLLEKTAIKYADLISAKSTKKRASQLFKEHFYYTSIKRYDTDIPLIREAQEFFKSRTLSDKDKKQALMTYYELRTKDIPYEDFEKMRMELEKETSLGTIANQLHITLDMVKRFKRWLLDMGLLDPEKEHRIKFAFMQDWSKDEIELLSHLWTIGVPMPNIAKRLKRTPTAIYAKVTRLRRKYPDKFPKRRVIY